MPRYTLIDLINNKYAKWEDKADFDVPTATLQIYDHIAETLNRPKDTHVNRASAANMCVRRRWYQRNGVDGTPLTPRKMVNFMLGDLVERVLVHFIINGLVGENKLYKEVYFGEEIGSFFLNGKEIKIHKQPNLVADLNGLEVTAHVDGFGRRNSDGLWELIEIKSSAEYGFDSFKKNGPGDYLKQAHVNMRTNAAIELDVRSVRFYYLLKNTGHPWDRLHYFDQAIFDSVASDYKIVNGSELPPIPTEYVLEKEMVGQGRGKPKLETGRFLLPFPCNGYCPYTNECYPEHKVEWEETRSGFQKPNCVVGEKT